MEVVLRVNTQERDSESSKVELEGTVDVEGLELVVAGFGKKAASEGKRKVKEEWERKGKGRKKD